MKLMKLLCLLLLFPNLNAFADDTLASSQWIGSVGSSPITIINHVSSTDHNDYFSFDVVTDGLYVLTLDQLNDNASLGLYRQDGSLVGYSINDGTQAEKLRYQLNRGRYIARVASWQHSANTSYRLMIKKSHVVIAPGPRVPGPSLPSRPSRPSRPPHTPQLGQITIRGIPYVDHSKYATLSTSQVLLGDYFNINTQTMDFSQGGTVKVFIQEVNGHTGLGVTGFELKGVHIYGKNLQVQAPWLQLFRNRKFNVNVFHYTGQKNHYAHAGIIHFK